MKIVILFISLFLMILIFLYIVFFVPNEYLTMPIRGFYPQQYMSDTNDTNDYSFKNNNNTKKVKDFLIKKLPPSIIVTAINHKSDGQMIINFKSSDDVFDYEGVISLQFQENYVFLLQNYEVKIIGFYRNYLTRLYSFNEKFIEKRAAAKQDELQKYIEYILKNIESQRNKP